LRINTTPVEAYRQAGNQEATKNQAAKEQSDLAHTPATKQITLPGTNDARSGGIKAPASPSLLQEVLSAEEKIELVKHFARLGDSVESSQIYHTDARTKGNVLTGMKLDVRG
jgi:hypothetical protein